jgi:hypothetical protein
LSEAELAELEDFDFGSIANVASHQLSAALPGAIQGATAGSAAGPLGALIGAVAGGALSAAQKPKPAAAPPQTVAATAPAAVPTPALAAAPIEPAIPAAPTVVAAPVATSPGAAPTAVGQLGQLLTNPLFQQAVAGLAAGKTGPSNIPTGAILNLLGSIANNAAYEAEAIEGPGNDSYLRNAAGRYRIDPMNPLERAAAVWDRLFPGGFTTERASDVANWLINAGINAVR